MIDEESRPYIINLKSWKEPILVFCVGAIDAYITQLKICT